MTPGGVYHDRSSRFPKLTNLQKVSPMNRDARSQHRALRAVSTHRRNGRVIT